MRCTNRNLFMTIMLPAAFLLFKVDAHATNIVANPGFETGDFTSWTTGGGSSWFVDVSAFGINGPHSGNSFAGNLCVGSNCITTPTSFFYQDLPTVNGQTYTLTFWFDLGTCQDTCGPEELKVLWGGNTAFDLATTTSGTKDPGWVEATVSGLQATSTTMRLEFVGRQDPAALGVDDIQVQGVPEPGTILLVGLGAVGLATLRKRVRQ